MAKRITKSFADSQELVDEGIVAKDVRKKKEAGRILEQSIMDDEEEQEIDIRPDKYITVISLFPGELNLSTLPGGKGKVFSFRSFGEKKRILYSNVVDIMESLPSFLEGGYYYIADKKVITKHGLDDIYKTLINKETIELLFTNDITEEDATAIYKSANKNQQETIVNLFVRKLTGGTPLNLNIVNAITRLSGVDISANVAEAKFYSQDQK
jgi:hypothetical protein